MSQGTALNPQVQRKLRLKEAKQCRTLIRLGDVRERNLERLAATWLTNYASLHRDCGEALTPTLESNLVQEE